MLEEENWMLETTINNFGLIQHSRENQGNGDSELPILIQKMWSQ